MRERIRSLACKSEKHTSKSPRLRRTSGVPHAMVLTACCVITPGARCWVHHRYAGLRSPLLLLAKLRCRPAVHGAGRRAGISRLGPSARDVAVSPGE